MGTVVRFPLRHARASVGCRAAKAVKSSALSPAEAALGVPSMVDHHSAGMLSRCHHFETADAFAPMSAAMASREGQSSMIDRNERSAIRLPIRQSVLKSKDILSGDVVNVVGQNVFMVARSQSVSDFKRMFIARTTFARERSGRSQEKMAVDLGVGQPTYAKYEKRTPLPHHLVLAFCGLCDVTPAWLYTAAIELKADKPKRTRARRAKSKRAA
jgi:DNA-binding XRE family transcriptional regulator